ncbi:Zinc finger and BTB domain-containing protein 7B [Bagarius yarrelli]|uniref:Zinc finger and BTB domain-containing protein 7B n=1 Tax=Bagarius yarrelli TaxID=175774 RepID=A0A556TUV1_BAGYA|nr:Zinc finger and BTB domain-containing protein 7B [Bagarius yarrelli]
MSPEEDGLIGIPFPEHSNELLSCLNAQRRSGLLCDLTLTTRGARYPTHRAVMAAVSLYFRRLFGAEEVGEAGEVSEGCSVLQLDCVTPDALDALLEFAYTATLTIRSSGMREVLEGAQLLGIQCVADACRHILGEEGESGELGVERGEPEGKRELGVPNKRRAGHCENDQRTPSRRKQNRCNVEKAESPRQLVWSTQSQEDKPKWKTPPSFEHKSGPPQNGALQRFQQVALMNGRGHCHPKPTEEDELKPEGLTPPFNHNLSQEMAVGGASEGVNRKRKSQAPQQCPVCQKIIHGAGKLPRHMRTHTGEKPFQCMTCGVRFTRNDKLKIHMRKHTGERPYSCPSCPARFLHSYDLKNHLSLHSGARPYECLLCHKAFAREDHLQRHRKGLACLELRPRLELRHTHHAASPHSPLSPASLSPTSSASAAPHFLFQQEADNPATPSHTPLTTAGTPYSRILQWREMEEEHGPGWREDDEAS